IGLVWGYDADHPFDSQCENFKEAGARFYVCPGTSSWNSLVGRTENALGNLANAARNGLQHGASGYLITDWGDGGHLQYLPISYPGICAGAAMSWCPESNAEPDVARAVDELVVRDTAGQFGDLLLEMGRVCDLIPKRFANGTAFSRLLFADIGAEGLLKGLTAPALEACIARFDELAARIAGARPQRGDAELLKAELRNAIAMAKHGAERGLAGLDEEHLDPAAFRHALQHAISQHEELWLARNRPGGLNESSGRLRRQLAKLG
ncbi:MAG: glycoside hydrolase, partial [Planctomycetota bacterium]